MCFICNGGTYEEHRANVRRHIDRYGWAVQHVETHAPQLPWAYTIGLTERFGHPELLVLGLAPAVAASLLNAMGEAVAAGEGYVGFGRAFVDPHDPLDDLDDLDDLGVLVGLRPVHPGHLADGLVDGWIDYYDHQPGPRRDLPDVLQVVVPDTHGRCEAHQLSQPLLDDPGVRLLTPTLNRAARRAEARRNRRRPGRKAPGR